MTANSRLLLVVKAGPLADGLQGLLKTIPGVEAIVWTNSFPSTLAEMVALRPAVIVLDLDPVEAQPAEVLCRLKTAFPDSSYVVLANDVAQRRVAEEAGADAVLLMGCRPSELVETVRGLLTARDPRHDDPND
ncbi:MAG: hypothetical protein ACM3US_07665 [Sphingomonadaceae bacterium]